MGTVCRRLSPALFPVILLLRIGASKRRGGSMRRINRRACLKGLGVTLSLPWMESLGWAGVPAGKADKPPVRLGFMYMPHGVIMDQFWPANPESFLSSPPPALES